MPVQPTYPGVYIEEVPSGIRPITGVATSVTCFIGSAVKGGLNTAISVTTFADYQRIFGGLSADHAMSYAVYQFFLNGGVQAYVVRVINTTNADTSSLSFPDGVATVMVLDAASPGAWGSNLRGRVDHNTRPLLAGEAADSLFNLRVVDIASDQLEVHRNVSIDDAQPNFVGTVLAERSSLVRLDPASTLATRPEITPAPDGGATEFEDSPDGAASSNAIEATQGADGDDLTGAEISGSAGPPKTGLHAFDAVEVVSLLCVPPFTVNATSGSTLDGDITAAVRTSALSYARGRMAMFIVDPLNSWTSHTDVLGANGVDSATFGLARDANAVLYFPHVRQLDPLRGGSLVTLSPSGMLAGVMARTDSQRGVWKSPAGIEATLIGASDLTVRLTDPENGQLNQQGVNCLRVFRGVGRVSWGARTLRGADLLADQWKYLAVRRMALFLEQSLYRGLQWVVFEPNDEPLWANIRLNVGAFMTTLFRQGAFQGATPREAFFVKCDGETTTQADIDNGIVNIEVGFAPLKPAEFVIIKLSQKTAES